MLMREAVLSASGHSTAMAHGFIPHSVGFPSPSSSFLHIHTLMPETHMAPHWQQ